MQDTPAVEVSDELRGSVMRITAGNVPKGTAA